MTAIFPQIFTDQPLILKTTYEGAENDHAIHCAGHLVGRIMLTPMSGGVESWLWTVTGPHIPPELQPSDKIAKPFGYCPTPISIGHH